jgi:hypothetical protein
MSWPWPARICETAPWLAARLVAVERPFTEDLAGDLPGDFEVTLDAVGPLEVERVELDVAGVRFAPVVERDEARDAEGFVDLELEAWDFCFVATGVRDSLVAPSARQGKWYRPDGIKVWIRARNPLGHPDLRQYRWSRARPSTVPITPKGYQ